MADLSKILGGPWAPPAEQRVSLPRVTSINDKPEGVEFLPQQEADQIVQSWMDEAARQGREAVADNANRTVISLFDASGVMSEPWERAGYNVVRYDIQNGDDINDFNAEMLLERHGDDNVWAVIAQPPCTDFASSGSQWWAEKDKAGLTELSNELVRQTMRTLELFRPPVWWLENPVGRIAKLNNLPKPVLSFDPWHFGDPWTKRTQYWGNFNPRLPTAMVAPTEGSKVHKLSSSAKFERSLTPEGVAYAMFMANNFAGMQPAQRLAHQYPGIEAGLFEQALAAGQTEQDIIDSIDDSFYENDLVTVREILTKPQQAQQEVGDQQPGRQPARLVQAGDRVAYSKPASRIFPGDKPETLRATVDFVYGNGYAAIVMDDGGAKDVVPIADLLSLATATVTPAINPELTTIFDQLNGRTQRTRDQGAQAAAASPQAERIQLVQDNFHDLLLSLMDAGQLEVNGSKTVNEENSKCL